MGGGSGVTSLDKSNSTLLPSTTVTRDDLSLYFSSTNPTFFAVSLNFCVFCPHSGPSISRLRKRSLRVMSSAASSTIDLSMLDPLFDLIRSAESNHKAKKQSEALRKVLGDDTGKVASVTTAGSSTPRRAQVVQKRPPSLLKTGFAGGGRPTKQAKSDVGAGEVRFGGDVVGG